MPPAARNATLAITLLTLAFSLSACGSQHAAPKPQKPQRAAQTPPEIPDITQVQSNWYKVSSATIAEADWGRVKSSNGLLEFTLGPNLDQRRRHELNLRHVIFTAASVLVADDRRGKNLVLLQGEHAAGCLFHAQGDGINVIIATRRCVPIWAMTGPRVPAQMWIRVQNLAPHPRLVYLKYSELAT